jgi:endonuclease G
VIIASSPVICPQKEAVCFHHCCPNGSSVTNDFVNNSIYVLSANRKTKFADWVAYAVEEKNLGGAHGNKRNWKKDPNLSDEYTLKPRDYLDASKTFQYDKGHQAPLADFTNNEHWRKTNYLSNITPQQAVLNRGAWKRLEKAERNLVKKQNYSYVRIVTGPYYEHNKIMPALPKSHLEHVVPNGYWKIIAVENSHKKIGVVAFKLGQYEVETVYCNYITDVLSINSLTKLDVFPAIRAGDIDKNATEQLLIDLQCPYETNGLG